MTARRLRGGALIVALLFLMAAASLVPGVRPLVHRAAVHFGFVPPPPAVSAGQPLDPISLVALDGAPVSLGEHAGRGLLINVFTSWCPSCNEEMPALAHAAPLLQREGIDVVGIDQAESSDRVERFLQTYGINYPVYIDTDQTTRSRLGARVIPTTVFVDRHNVVRYVHVGPLDVTAFVAMARAWQ
jgi:cytochrome c biogenesis protein CcmG, thiol:disulfide interchange protein DsbE